MNNIEEIIFEQFSSMEVDEKTFKLQENFARLDDDFRQQLTNEQLNFYENLESLREKVDIDNEKNLIHFVLDFLRSILK